MNLTHLKYAVTIANTMSINKAAEELSVGAPALSRAVKELETSLGITLFDRSPKGMFLTPDGELFIKYAKKILKEIDDVEEVFKDETFEKREQFSISVPRASYVADAFSEFSKRIKSSSRVELFYKETNAFRAINNILKEDYKLGILRYSEQYDGYYKAMMKDKGLVGELINEFVYSIIVSKHSPLAKKKLLSFNDLNGFIEIAHADPYVPSLSLSEVKKDELPDHNGSRIFVFERASQFEIISKNPNSYMWVSSIPQDLLDRYHLVELKCPDNKRKYKDVLIHKENYILSKLDKMFIEELVKAKRKTFN